MICLIKYYHSFNYVTQIQKIDNSHEHKWNAPHFEIKFKILVSNERENNSKNYDIFQVFDKKNEAHI